MCKICVFAGTTEGRELVGALAGRGATLTACVATDYGEALLKGAPDVRVCAGRMDRAEMEAFLRAGKFDQVIDATHPYADRATENIFAACEATDTPYLRLLRGSTAEARDGACVPDVAACVEYLRGTQGNVLLTTGSKELPAFCRDAELRERLYVRVLPMAASLEICEKCGVRPDHILAMQGPFDEEMNLAMLRATRAAWLVTKDTGDAGGYAAKLRAAERAHAQVIVIGRPAQREGQTLSEVLSGLEARFQLSPARKRVVLAGIGMGGAETQTMGLQRALWDADCLIGARRMLNAVDCAAKDTFEAVAADAIAERIRQDEIHRRFLVLLSGDSGFYSGARRLCEALRDLEVEVLPGIGSLSYFCAKLHRPWEDVRAVSLHGRECDLEREVRDHPAVFALVGGEDGAKKALARLEAAGLGACAACVGERLGYPEERVLRGTVASLAQEHIEALSVILIENENWGEARAAHGLPDEAFLRDETPMTKSEVRSIALSKLAPGLRSVVYDVGAGSGSVTVEAAQIARAGRVYAIERKERALELSRKNIERFRLRNVELVAGTAPEALQALPAPTHAFIGGSSGNLRSIVECLLAKNPAVRIVATAVTLETLAELTELSREFRECDVAQVSVGKPRKIGGYMLMTAQNPVYIFTLQN